VGDERGRRGKGEGIELVGKTLWFFLFICIDGFTVLCEGREKKQGEKKIRQGGGETKSLAGASYGQPDSRVY